MADHTCTIPDCEKPLLARGWCSAHWTRWQRHGHPLAGGTPRKPAPEICRSEGCSNPPHSRGLCATHWRRAMGDADPDWRERFLAQRREWHGENPERVSNTRRQSRERHLETVMARIAKWRSENRDQVFAGNWTARRRHYGLPETVTEVVHPDAVFMRDGGNCQICREPVDALLNMPDPMAATVDHIIPVMDPRSTHSYANVQLAHWDCNRRKNRTVPDDADLVGGSS